VPPDQNTGIINCWRTPAGANSPKRQAVKPVLLPARKSLQSVGLELLDLSSLPSAFYKHRTAAAERALSSNAAVHRPVLELFLERVFIASFEWA
jgi:hypothetical protein